VCAQDKRNIWIAWCRLGAAAARYIVIVETTKMQSSQGIMLKCVHRIKEIFG